ncbi:hypothetical protein OQA88_9956 [Cercophora sp. LCS_1]
MKFSGILTTLLATLVIASPVANPEPAAELVVRQTVEQTAEYSAAIAAKPGLVANKYYWFTMQWPLNSIPVDEKTTEELKELRKKLGFDHIGVVFGQITETKTGKGKNEKTKKHYSATLVHMVKTNPATGTVTQKSSVYKYDGKALKYGGETTAKKIDAAKKAAKAWVDEHPTYAVEGNNCNDFAKAVFGKL